MPLIIPAILSLVDHLLTLESNPEAYRPECCPHCGKAGLWCHGYYFRQSDRENPGGKSLNPIPIPRFRCPHCGRTCSALPECIPPRRWYLWSTQQFVLEQLLAGDSAGQISERVKPCRRTIERRHRTLMEQFEPYSFYLRNRFSDLGRHAGFKLFWKACLSRMPLSGAMVFLNQCGVSVP